ncbi:MAG: PSD1 and planctomycete cytochrome C domain-containing protein [Planctomycetota bacterium]|nr:PSD1 and planctomycete cytochrome C domain-containing protein [Planctomycetota bacterium]
MNDYQNQVTRYQPLASAFVIVLAAVASGIAQDAARDVDGTRFFSEKIEPLLKSHCFECHSHAAGEMEGRLTLDSKSGWAEGGGRGPAIVPGNPADSLLIKAVRRGDAKLRMPPDEKLSDANIELLVEWIKRGAPDPRNTKFASNDASDPMDWWSLRVLKRPAVPQAAQQDGEGGNAIDAFVQQRLRAEGLPPASRADRRTLIRRLYLDLHGLPPTPEAVAAFVVDPDPMAYEKLADRLLESPRYGERWARHWLDTVHFADSHGCEHDVFRPNAWRYRDYVIDSLNRDTPWARFIREQLAADRFYPDETQLTAALGFIAAGPLELSRAGTAPITFDYLDRDDMVAQTIVAFASTTANCARCHDHKFDPISQEDYYSLQAVFAGVGKGDVEFDADPAVANERRRWNELLAATRSDDRSKLLAPEHADVVARWEQEFSKKPATWEPLSPTMFLSSDGATLKRLEDNSLLASDVRPEKDTYTITVPTSLTKLTALRLDVLADDSLPMKGPGRQDNGNLHLTEFEAFVLDAEATEPMRLGIRAATADWDQAGWTIAHALDGNVATAWGIYPKVGQSHHAVFELEEPRELKPSSQIVVVLKQLHGGGHLIGRLKLYATDASGATAEVLPESVRIAVKLPRDQRTQEQQVAIAVYALRLHAEKQLAALPAPPSVYAVSSSYSHANKLATPMTPKVVHVLRRGDIHKPGDVASPGALSAIGNLAGRFELQDPNDEASRRAALADWLAASDNPLTWRSVVNRVWSIHFGRGLCDTPNDFGRMGGTPSHPELLDWLAAWFRDDAKGSLKQLHRLILLSSAYQRTSRVSSREPDQELLSREGEAPAEPGAEPGVRRSLLGGSLALPALAIDAENRLLWRMNRRRLDAESVRDAVLQISGRIDLTMGGPGIQQFTQSQGAQLTPYLDYDAFDWNDPTAARRSIYRVVWRGIADPFMESLDFPDLGQLSPQRGFSVSALQSLTVFNNDFVLHHSQLLADKLTASHATVDEQVAQACRLIYLREPGEEEYPLLVAYTQQHGLAATCRVLFNSNEFLFVD